MYTFYRILFSLSNLNWFFICCAWRYASSCVSPLSLITWFCLAGGCPVIKGTKWSATKWLHVENYAVWVCEEGFLLVTYCPQIVSASLFFHFSSSDWNLLFARTLHPTDFSPLLKHKCHQLYLSQDIAIHCYWLSTKFTIALNDINLGWCCCMSNSVSIQ